MRKNGTLYTVNKYNKNLFAYAGPMDEGDYHWTPSDFTNAYTGLGGSAPNIQFLSPLLPTSTSSPANITGTIGGLDIKSSKVSPISGFGALYPQEPFMKTFAGDIKQGLTNAAPAIGSTVGNFIGGKIAGGLNSGAGSAVSGIGNFVGGAVGKVNPLLGGAISAASGIIGGGINALVGTAVDEKKLGAANAGTAAYNNFSSNEGSFDNITGPVAQANVQNAYKSGLLNKGWAAKRNRRLKQERADARNFAFNSVENNVNNLAQEQTDLALRSSYAFGGPLASLDGSMGAVEYGLMSDYLAGLDRRAKEKNNNTDMINVFEDGGIMIKPSHRGRLTELKKRTGKTEAELYNDGNPAHKKMVVFARNARKWHADGGPLFALGGDMQTHGSDFSSGLMRIDTGGSHEMNPYEGIQLGVDSQGTPNLVEEGETVFDDYVYSARILCDETTKKKFHLPKKKDISYAELSKKLEKEANERPNDPISRAALKAQMHTLADEQERQKSEEEAAQAREAFEALSPEEKVAVMQQMQQPQQLPAEMQQEQMVPEEAMVQQQEMIQPEEQMFAMGGNLYPDGGSIRDAILGALATDSNPMTVSGFAKWMKDNGVNIDGLDLDNLTYDSLDTLDWDALRQNPSFVQAITKENPLLGHAIQAGYDFGTGQQKPSTKATIQSIDRGNWQATDGKGWLGSEDLAFRQATEGMTEDAIKALTTEQLADLMSKTDAYKNTSKWLENSDNALLYLNTLLNDPNTPEAAKKHALMFVKDGRWKDDYNYTYDDVFGKVRSTSPGTYWHSVEEANRGNKTMNFIQNDDGTIEQLLTPVPKDWTPERTYSWSGDTDDLTYNYYKAKAEEAAEEEAEEDLSNQRRIVPVYKNEVLGLEDFGPLASMGMMWAGIGKPKTGYLDAALAAAKSPVRTARPAHTTGYYTYKPIDPFMRETEALASSSAAQRAITNSSLPTANKQAAQLAADYNYQTQVGRRMAEDLRYNNAERLTALHEQKDTDRWNAGADNEFALRNAAAYNDANRYYAGLMGQIGAQKMEADAAWNKNWYGNVQALSNAIGARQKENRQMNMIADMAAASVFGNINPDYFNPSKSLRWETDEEMRRRLGNTSAKGGKLKKKKKKGLTF